MTTQRRRTESFRSIAGGALVGLGLHILSGNVVNAASQLRLLVGNHPGGATAGEGLGVLSSAVLASSQAAQAYAVLDQHAEEALQVILTYDGEVVSG